MHACACARSAITSHNRSPKQHSTFSPTLARHPRVPPPPPAHVLPHVLPVISPVAQGAIDTFCDEVEIEMPYPVRRCPAAGQVGVGGASPPCVSPIPTRGVASRVTLHPPPWYASLSPAGRRAMPPPNEQVAKVASEEKNPYRSVRHPCGLPRGAGGRWSHRGQHRGRRRRPRPYYQSTRAWSRLLVPATLRCSPPPRAPPTHTSRADRKFRGAYKVFWVELVALCKHAVVYESQLVEKLFNWCCAMSSAPIRSIRHGACIAVLQARGRPR